MMKRTRHCRFWRLCSEDLGCDSMPAGGKRRTTKYTRTRHSQLQAVARSKGAVHVANLPASPLGIGVDCWQEPERRLLPESDQSHVFEQHLAASNLPSFQVDPASRLGP